MDLRRGAGVLRSWAKYIIAGTLLAAIVAFAVSSAMPKTFQGHARILVGQTLQTSNPDVNQFDAARNVAKIYTEVAASRNVLDRVSLRLDPNTQPNDDTIAALKKRLSVQASADQPIIEVLATGSGESDAANLANAMADELVASAPTVSPGAQDQLAFIQADLKAMEVEISETRKEIADLAAQTTRNPADEAKLATLEQRLVTLRSNYATLVTATQRENANQLSIFDRAVGISSSPSVAINVLLGALLGFLVMVAIAFTWETVDDRLKSPEDVEEVTGLATVGQIGRMPGEKDRKPFYRLATLLYPRSPAAEAFRTLRTNLEFASVDQTFRTIVVTSSVPREGKTVVASNLAVAFAQGGRRVILLDADLRRPNVHEMFGLRNDRGLTDMIRSDDVKFEQVANQTEVPGLLVVTSGLPPANPAELLGSQRMQRILERLRDLTDVVVIDTAPVGAVTDAAVLAADADATIFVIRGRRTSERTARRGREALEKVHAHVVGVVLNDLPVRSGDATTYYASDAEEQVPTAVALPTPATRTSRGGS